MRLFFLFSSFEKSFLFANAHSDIIFRQLERRNNDERQGRFEAIPRAIQDFFLYGPKLHESQRFTLAQNLPANDLITQIVIDSIKPKTPPAIVRRVANFFREKGASKANFAIAEKLLMTVQFSFRSTFRNLCRLIQKSRVEWKSRL